jgi:hypothetical protein
LKPPKYTDLYRFSAPYTRSDATDVGKTFERAREQLERKAAEQKLRSVISIKKGSR